MQDDAVIAFRAHYRKDVMPKPYHGWLHFAFTVSLSLGVIVFAISRVHAMAPLEWLTIPATFLYANLAEYWGHRGPMHHKMPGLGLVFARHAGQHHRFFSERMMGYEGHRDFFAVLFPPVLVTFFLIAFTLPMALFLAFIATPNVAWLYVATGIGYFLNYELLHWSYHHPEGSWILKLPGMRFLARHHTLHHDTRLMARANFNITYPLADLLFGTMRRKQP